MAVYWFWTLLILFAVMLAAFPAWPHSRRWRDGPSFGALIVVIVIAGVIWLGFFAVWWPWTALSNIIEKNLLQTESANGPPHRRHGRLI